MNNWFFVDCNQICFMKLIDILIFFSNQNKIDVEIVKKLTTMLDEFNVHAKSFRVARDRYREQPFHDLKLRLIAERTKDGRIYNMPTVSEVAALIVGDVDSASPRDIIMENRSGNSKIATADDIDSKYPTAVFAHLLPHAHLLLFLHQNSKYPTADDIDRVISAEIPCPIQNLKLHQCVKEHMIHGPCGVVNKSLPCMKNGKRSRFYPKNFQSITTISEDGFPHYRRRDNGICV